MDINRLRPEKWKDHPENPIIEPPFPEFLIGDPTVVLPSESPDGKWHLFANTLLGIHHYEGVDGIHFKRVSRLFPGMRAFVFCEERRYFMFYEEFKFPMLRSRIVMRESQDLVNWTNPSQILEPELSWEVGRVAKTCGNPCLVKDKSGNYRLYYSANLVFLKDLGFCEPKFIGVAKAEDIRGPYSKFQHPIISPSFDDSYRNKGAGAIKVIFDEKEGLYIGFNNGIYEDESGKTRSAILLLTSEDGMDWKDSFENPIIAPEGAGWKRGLVYQLDIKRVGDEFMLWYNARSGWRFAKERIGLATARIEPE